MKTSNKRVAMMYSCKKRGTRAISAGRFIKFSWFNRAHPSLFILSHYFSFPHVLQVYTVNNARPTSHRPSKYVSYVRDCSLRVYNIIYNFPQSLMHTRLTLWYRTCIKSIVGRVILVAQNLCMCNILEFPCFV